jgi:hypothetical protein
LAVPTPEGSAVVPALLLGGSSPRRFGRLLQAGSPKPSKPANAMGRRNGHKALLEDESKRKLPKIIPQ